MILQQVEEALLALLAPLLEANGGTLRQIQVESFGNGDLGQLVQKLKSRMPGAFLSIPRVVFSNGVGPRVQDATLSYAFIAGVANRASSDERKAVAYAMFDRLLELLSLQRIANTGLHTTNAVDFIGMNDWDFTDEVPEVAVIACQFSLRIRNISLNTPAR